jgi:hypothetical protein
LFNLQTGADGSTNSANCYEYLCRNPNQFFVKVDGLLNYCPAGQSIKIGGYSGSLTCPSAVEDICLGTTANADLHTVSSVSPASGDSGTSITITGRQAKFQGEGEKKLHLVTHIFVDCFLLLLLPLSSPPHNRNRFREWHDRVCV